MKQVLEIAFLVLFCSVSVFSQQKASPRFKEHRVSTYQGKKTNPKWISRPKTGEWRDELGKLVEPPNINFAGKYYLAVHSCGTGCRYYTLTDLSTGKDLNVLQSFAKTENPPKTKDGQEYMSLLYHRRDSNLLVVQYEFDNNGEHSCRERSFVFMNGKLRPITKTKYSCRKF